MVQTSFVQRFPRAIDRHFPAEGAVVPNLKRKGLDEVALFVTEEGS